MLIFEVFCKLCRPTCSLEHRKCVDLCFRYWKMFTNMLRVSQSAFNRVQFRTFRNFYKKFIDEELNTLPSVNPLAKCEGGEPLKDVLNPFAREKPQCVACKYKLDLNYKNTRLLSQFISSFSGRLFEKHQTGLCEFQQNRLRSAIFFARKSALMPVLCKEPKYLKDPRLFDPMKPSRPNPYT